MLFKDASIVLLGLLGHFVGRGYVMSVDLVIGTPEILVCSQVTHLARPKKNSALVGLFLSCWKKRARKKKAHPGSD